MPLLSMIAFVLIVVFGPVELDFWTEAGLIVIGVQAIASLALIAENTKKK